MIQIGSGGVGRGSSSGSGSGERDIGKRNIFCTRLRGIEDNREEDKDGIDKVEKAIAV